MELPAKGTGHLYHRITRLFLYDTWLGSILIATGILLTIIAPVYPANLPLLTSSNVTKLGIAVFILMPIIRVLLMLWTFLRQRDPVYTAISATVLMIILVSVFMR